MRLLRWGVELASDAEADKRVAGIAALQALVDFELLQFRDQAFVDAINRTLPARLVQAYADTGDVVLRDDGPSVGVTRTDEQGTDHDTQ